MINVKGKSEPTLNALEDRFVKRFEPYEAVSGMVVHMRSATNGRWVRVEDAEFYRDRWFRLREKCLALFEAMHMKDRCGWIVCPPVLMEPFRELYSACVGKDGEG